MKLVLSIVVAIIALIAVVVIAAIALRPWMDTWGATPAELTAAFHGDELVVQPAVFVNRAVTIQATPEQIYPWLVQIGAAKGGWYSYDFFETNFLRCKITNADRIHPEWQDTRVGDLVKMCPDGNNPPAYTVALMIPNQAFVMGHQDNGEWVDLWQFIILPQPDGSSRLVTRTRTMMTGGFWDVIHPGVFIMERGMLLGIKQRAEAAAKP